MKKPSSIAPADGRLAVLVPGLGAVATTLIAGVEAVRARHGEAHRLAHADGDHPARQADGEAVAAHPRARARSRTSATSCFGAWDVFPDDAYESATHARVLEQDLLDQLREPLSAVKPMTRGVLARVRAPARRAQREEGADQAGPRRAAARGHPPLHEGRTTARAAVMVWCASTEVYLEPSAVHAELGEFERAMAGERSRPSRRR